MEHWPQGIKARWIQTTRWQASSPHVCVCVFMWVTPRFGRHDDGGSHGLLIEIACCFFEFPFRPRLNYSVSAELLSLEGREVRKGEKLLHTCEDDLNTTRDAEWVWFFSFFFLLRFSGDVARLISLSCSHISVKAWNRSENVVSHFIQKRRAVELQWARFHRLCYIFKSTL